MKRLLLLVGLLSASVAKGDVTALNQIVKGSESWTVPKGKTLSLTHAVWTGSAPPPLGELRVFVIGASEDEHVQFVISTAIGFPQNQVSTYSFPSGTRFELVGGKDRSIVLIGKLADSADLFASIPSRFQEVNATDTKLTATLKADSTRPARVEVEKSDDLETWKKDTDASVRKTGPQSYEVATARKDEARKFVRAKVTARPGE